MSLSPWAMNDNRRAMLLMVAFGALWGAIEAFGYLLLRPYPTAEVVWWRYAAHLGLMAAVWGWRDPASLWHTRRAGFQLARSMLMLGMPMAYVFALQGGLPRGTLFALFWLSPLLILVLARVLAGERAHPVVWAAALVGYGGVLVVYPPARFDLPSAALALGMALCFGLYMVMTRSLRTEARRANLFYTAGGVFLVLTPLMPFVWVTPSAHDMLVLTAIGVVGFVALYALDMCAATAPVSVSATFAYLQIGAILGFAYASGRGSWHSLLRVGVGLLLIAAAALYLWLREPQPGIARARSPGGLVPTTGEK